MKRVLLFSLLLLISKFSQAQTFVVKYSSLDCFYCNDKLTEIVNSIKYGLIVVVKEGDQKDLAALNHDRYNNQLKIFVSDSAFFSYDSSNRSKIYLLDENVIVGSSYLKDCNVNYFNRLAAKKGAVVVDNLKEIVNTQKNLYLIPRDRFYVLKINKSNLLDVQDSIFLEPKKIDELLGRVNYGNFYLDSLALNRNIEKFISVPHKTRILDVSVFEDTVFFVCSMSSIVIKGNDTSKAVIAGIIKYVNKSDIDVSKINIFETFKQSANNYNLTLGSLFYYKGYSYMPIKAQSLKRDSILLFVKLKQMGHTYEFVSFPEYYLSKEFVNAGIGDKLRGRVQNDGIFAHTYMSDLYDIDKKRVYSLGLSESNYDVVGLNNLNLKIQFQNISFSRTNQRLDYFFMKNDSIYHNVYNITDNSTVLRQSKMLAPNLKNVNDFYPLVSAEEGYFTYDPIRKAIKYWNY